jgi:hypothetical protein
MNKKTKNAKQFILGCAGMTAGMALILLSANHELLQWFGIAIMFFTGILSSSEEKAARSVPLVVLFLLCMMGLVICSIYRPVPVDSGTHKPSTWYVLFIVTLWAASLGWECWTYFRQRSPKEDHLA